MPWLRPLLLVMLLLALVAPVSAQDDATPILIQGTPEMEDLVGAIRDNFEADFPDIEVQIDPRGGLRGGFDALCSGEVDVVMSTEPITELQITDCTNQDAGFIETVIAYEAVVLLATPEAGVDCLDQDTIFNAWQLGAPEELTWLDLTALELDTPVTFYGLSDLTSTYRLFRSLTPAGDLREDIVTTDDPAAILEKVQEEASGAFGFMSLADLESLDAGGDVLPLDIEDADLNCISPSLSTLEGRTYPFARTLYLYLNSGSAQRPEVQTFMEFVLTNEAGAPSVVEEQGFTVPTEATFEYGLNNILNGNVGRTFTRPTSPVDVSTAEAGDVYVAGTSMLYDLTSDIKSEFGTRFPNALVTIETSGNSAGWEAFCNGEIDVLQTTRLATDEEVALCTASGIDPYLVDLGYQALVLAVPAGNDWLECMTPEIAALLLRAGAEDQPAPTKWNEINADWPDSDILLVVPPLSTGASDFLAFTLLDDLSFVLRDDVVENDDALYRAQGIANTDNGLTYLWWGESQTSTAAVRLLPVSAGETCVAPDAAIFASGSYPLAFPVRYYFNPESFTQPLVRAFLWHMYDAATLDTLAGYEFAGLDLGVFGSTQRDDVFDFLAALDEQIAAEEAEATQEPAEAATPEATEEVATPEATEEMTPEATKELATPEATEEMTPEATEETATPEATEEAAE